MAQTNRAGNEVFQGVITHNQVNDGVYKGSVKKQFSAETANATPVVVYAHPLPELGSAMIVAYCHAVQDDATQTLRTTYTHAFRRAASGNVTAVGSATSATANDSAGTPTFTIAANTSDQTIDLTLTGEAATNYYWLVEVEILEINL